jgi:hypothetical protein
MFRRPSLVQRSWGGCLRLVPGAAGGAGVDAARAVTERLVLGAAAGAQRSPGLSQRALGGVQDKIAADQQRPPGVRGDAGRMGRFLGFLCRQAVVEGAGGAAADDLGHGLGVGQVGADPGAAGRVEDLRQPADALGVVAAAAPVVDHGDLRGPHRPGQGGCRQLGWSWSLGTVGSPATRSAWSGWRRR